MIVMKFLLMLTTIIGLSITGLSEAAPSNFIERFAAQLGQPIALNSPPPDDAPHDGDNSSEARKMKREDSEEDEDSKDGEDEDSKDGEDCKDIDNEADEGTLRPRMIIRSFLGVP